MDGWELLETRIFIELSSDRSHHLRPSFYQCKGGVSLRQPKSPIAESNCSAREYRTTKVILQLLKSKRAPQLCKFVLVDLGVSMVGTGTSWPYSVWNLRTFCKVISVQEWKVHLGFLSPVFPCFLISGVEDPLSLSICSIWVWEYFSNLNQCYSFN
jgi:hypothetical protein